MPLPRSNQGLQPENVLVRGIRWRYANGTVVEIAFSAGGLRRLALELSNGKVFTPDEVVEKFGTTLPVRRAVLHDSHPVSEEDVLQVVCCCPPACSCMP